MTKFNVEYVNTPYHYENIVISTFRMRLLQGSDLKKDLTTWPHCNLEEVISTTKGYIKLEEEEV